MAFAKVWPVLALCACAAPSPPAVDEPACNPISKQERWGRVVADPEAEGFTLAAESDHFMVYAAPGVAVSDKDLEIGEAHLALIAQRFGRGFDQKISFFAYPDEDALKQATGMGLLIRRDALQVHLLGGRHLHEVVHLMTYHWAGHRSVALFEEGLAEASGNWAWRPGDPADKLAIKDWTDEHVDVMTRRWLAEGKVPPLTSLATERAFRNYLGPLKGESYVFAASFSLYLIERFGADSFLGLLERICVEDEQDAVLLKVRGVLGVDLEQLDHDWRGALAR